MATGLDETGTRPVRDVPTLVDETRTRPDRRREWAGTALLAAAGGLLGGLLFLVAYKGMPDDSYITLDYARNVVEHWHWGLTPFRDANSATSPLNVWLLAGGILVTGRPVVAVGLVLVLTTAVDGGVGRSARRGSSACDAPSSGSSTVGLHRHVADLRLGRRAWSRSWSRRCSWRWSRYADRTSGGRRGASSPASRCSHARTSPCPAVVLVGVLFLAAGTPAATQGGARGRRRGAGDAAVAHLVVVRARQLRAGQPDHQDQRCLPRR